MPKPHFAFKQNKLKPPHLQLMHTGTSVTSESEKITSESNMQNLLQIPLSQCTEFRYEKEKYSNTEVGTSVTLGIYFGALCKTIHIIIHIILQIQFPNELNISR